MTLKTLVTGVAAAAVVSAAAVGVTSIAPGASLASAPAVQPVVFGIPMPLDTPCGATADQLQSVLDRLAAPGGSFHGDKSDLVQGGIGILEGRTADRMLANAYQSGTLPATFNVSPPVCGPGNSATATVTSAGRSQDVTFVPGGSSGWQVSRASATSILAVMAG